LTMEESQKAMLLELEQILTEQEQSSRLVSDPELFVKEILGYELQWFHQKWLRLLLENKRNLILAPRGHGKSTICTISYPLWRLVRNPELRILIVSNTQSQAGAFLREIRSHLESNIALRAACSHLGELAGKPWSESELNLAIRKSVAKEPNISAMGVLGPIISKHYDIIILDDVIDQENAVSQKEREKILLWFYKTLAPCLEPGGEIHIIGTRYHYLDLYGHLIGQEFKDYHYIYRAIRDSENGEVALWEAKFPLELLREKRREAGSAIFNSQYQNDVELMKGAMFKPEWIQYYQSAPARLEKMIGIDLALSEKQSGDYFALVVAGADRKAGKIYVLDAIRTRLSFSRQIDLALNYFEKHNLPESPVLRVCVEANGYQEAFAQKLREAGLPVKSVIRIRDKISRGWQLQARFENQEIFFPARSTDPTASDNIQDLIQELLLFPQTDHDDLFDALEIIVTQFKLLSYQEYLKPCPDLAPI